MSDPDLEKRGRDKTSKWVRPNSLTSLHLRAVMWSMLWVKLYLEITFRMSTTTRIFSDTWSYVEMLIEVQHLCNITCLLLCPRLLDTFSYAHSV